MTLAQGYYRSATPEPARYVLRRRDELVADSVGYVLEEPIRYVHWDGRVWIIPDPRVPDAEFETDLASIPVLASWLVPRDGRHTPAAIVHDAMILGTGETKNYRGLPDDVEVGPEDADEIFRAGMHYLGVKFLRRWMMWAAVSLRTHWVAGRTADRVRLAAVPLLFLFGLLAVPDVLDVPGDVGLPGSWVLEWQAPAVGESDSFLAEAGTVAGLVAVLAAAHTLLWGSRWRFGLVVGLAVPLLAFPLLVPAIAFGSYLLVEEAIALGLLVARRLGIAHQPVVASTPTRALVAKIPSEASAPPDEPGVDGSGG